jgi:hypothetical protein
MIHSRCLTALMIGKRGVEVESMPANQHAVGSVTETRGGEQPPDLTSACRLPVVDGPAWSLRRDGSPGVKDFSIDRDRSYLRESLPISTGRAGPSGASAQRISRAGY